METSHGLVADRTQLMSAVRSVRLRWKLRRAMLGAAITIAAVLVVLVALSYLLAALEYRGIAVAAAQGVAAATVIGLVWWLVVRPLLPTPSDEQIALFIEEREPSLDAALVTAVDLDGSARRTGEPGRSPALAARLFHVARERIRVLDDGRRIDRAAMQQSAGALAFAAMLAFVAALTGPAVLRHGMRLLLTPWDRGQPVSLYAILVEPGDATVPRGGDQLVSATLHGFQSDGVELIVRRADSAGWTRVPMARDPAGGSYAFRLLDVTGAMDYFVESNGIRSRTFHLAIADLPYVKSLRLEYRYPAYTQIPPRIVEEGGDVVAIEGTQVRVRVTPTVAAAGGRLLLDNGDTVALRRGEDGTLSGTMRVSRPGFYRVQLRTEDDRLVPASLDYAIDVLPDRPPAVSFSKPGADRKVLAVDEVYSEARAEDDYGVKRVELVFSVNGGPERAVTLHESTGRNLTELAAGYTFMLEEYRLEPGDIVSYFARATDNNAVSGARTATSDIYFLEVRPYAQDYRQSQQAGGGGGGQGEQRNQLSETQREIIAGTFRTERDRAQTPPKELEENLATLRLSQQRLREQVEELARRLDDRGIAGSDSNYRKIAGLLPLASAQMDTAERLLGQGDPREALGPEQRTLQQLQRAEAVYRDIRVSQGGGGGGGGGGGEGSSAQDLADLFELQQDRLRNQYESVQRGQQEQDQRQQAQLDETMEKLKQLAARQQQENERAQRKLDSLRLGQSGSGRGGSQRQMAQDAEQAARQLERLARERESRELANAARRLQDAADAMRRAAASGQQGGGTAEGRAALEQLREARRLLDEERQSRAGEGVQDALRQARRLAEQERRVQEEVGKLSGAEDRAERTRDLADRKQAMADQVRDLKSRLDRMALENRRDQRATAEKLAGAAQGMRDEKLEEKIRASQRALGFADPEYARALENDIGRGISELGQRLEEAARTAREGSREGDRQATTLDRTRELVEGMESLAERMEPQAAGRRNQQGQGGQNAGPNGSPRQGSRIAGPPGGMPSGMPDGQQFGRELRERLGDAEALRRDLQRQGVDVSELDRAISRLRSLADESLRGDAEALQRLRSLVVEGLKGFEFDLRRALLGGDRDRVLLGRSGEVPEGYRQAVEEYYRSLAAGKKTP